MLFNLQKIISSSSDEDELNEINPQELKSLTETNKIEHLTDAIKKFCEEFYQNSELKDFDCESYINNFRSYINRLLYVDKIQNLILNKIKKYLGSIDLLHVITKICVKKKHKFIYDNYLIEKIALKNSITFSNNLRTFSEKQIKSYDIEFLETFSNLKKFLVENELIKFLNSYECKNYCINCILDLS
ncbi:hypothetical protein GVAV_000750 [Gurleya vavrai]